MKIGYDRNSYNVRRNIIGRVPGVQYVQANDLYRLMERGRKWWRARWRLPQVREKTIHYNSFRDFNLNQVDLFHFFNVVSYGRTPWISTFETRIPRFGRSAGGKKIRQGLGRLAAAPCRGLIALSECSLRMQQTSLEDYPDFRDAIRAKLTCLHPPQETLVESHASKPVDHDGPIRFVFVGNAFFRKGGEELLAMLSSFRKRGADLRLSIVSRIKMDPYATRENPSRVHRARRMIGKRKEWVEHFESLPNEQVLDLMRRSHVGLLPTYADTYGYSVLEAQAAGCPVITTDVRALPEINSDETGWLIRVPKNDRGEGLYRNKKDRQLMSETIKHGLQWAIGEILENPSLVRIKGSAALERIRHGHSPAIFGERLNEIYRKALK